MVWGGWAPDIKIAFVGPHLARWWPAWTTTPGSFSCCTLSLFPLMDATSIPTKPSIDQACHMYSSFFCDSLALQCETSELGSPWAGYLVSKRYSGDEYRVFSEILQTNQNNSYKTECIKTLIGWVLKLEENCIPCAIQVTINNQEENYKTILRTVYCRYLIIVKIIIISW